MPPRTRRRPPASARCWRQRASAAGWRPAIADVPQGQGGRQPRGHPHLRSGAPPLLGCGQHLGYCASRHRAGHSLRAAGALSPPGRRRPQSLSRVLPQPVAVARCLPGARGQARGPRRRRPGAAGRGRRFGRWRWLDAPEGVEGKREEIIAAVRGTWPRLRFGRDQSRAPAAAEWRRLSRRTWGIVWAPRSPSALGPRPGPRPGSHRDEPSGHLDQTRPRRDGASPRAAHQGLRPSQRPGDHVRGPETEDDPNSLLHDTWAYDPVANTWTELKPAGAVPSPRIDSLAWPTTRSPGG